MKKQTLKLNSVKTHSVRYDAETKGAQDNVVTSVYIMKSALNGQVPERVTITVEAVK